MKKLDMETNNIHRHCTEVESLMGGKSPFVTRHGITIVALGLLVIVTILLFSEGASQQLMKEMIKHTIEQVTSKI